MGTASSLVPPSCMRKYPCPCPCPCPCPVLLFHEPHFRRIDSYGFGQCKTWSWESGLDHGRDYGLFHLLANALASSSRTDSINKGFNILSVLGTAPYVSTLRLPVITSCGQISQAIAYPSVLAYCK